ncbi:MAG: hypothetical protein WBA93_11530 [Microcoleaceae cyanobacterium]
MSSTSAQSNSSSYQPKPGSYPVEETDRLALEVEGNRTLPLRIYYPKGEGKFPVILFSHGVGASKARYSLLSKFWASYGYVIIHPTHADALVLQRKAATPENLEVLVQTMLKDVQGWQQRVQDLISILDALPELETQLSEFQGKFDLGKIGVGGHSYGAYTAQLIGGARIDIPGGKTSTSFLDPRVQAILLLSPQGSGQQGLTTSSWNQQTLPMMVMTGSRDRGAQGQDSNWKMEPFELSPAGDKYLVFIEGANHFSFSIPLSETPPGQSRLGGSPKVAGTQQQAIADYIKIASLAFWDTYLKQNSEAKTYLHSDALEVYSGGNLSISTK